MTLLDCCLGWLVDSDREEAIASTDKAKEVIAQAMDMAEGTPRKNVEAVYAQPLQKTIVLTEFFSYY